MNANNAIRAAAERAKLSMVAVSKAMGRNENYMSVTLSRGSTPQADTLAAMLDVCGYKLAAIPRDDVPGSALVIDPPDA